MKIINLLSPSLSLSDPQFAGAAVIPYTEKLKDEIYFFFSEVNSTTSLDEEPYRARIGRVCMVTIFYAFLLHIHCCEDSRFLITFASVAQVDEGGLQNVLPNSWTTFLKARVMCGKAGTPVQYNNFKQAFVLTSSYRTGLIYGIFSNAW